MDELYEVVAESVRSFPAFLLLVIASTVVAAAGFWKDSVAILIGAMVIAPLVGPNMGLALATNLAEPRLALRSALFLAITFAVSISAAAAIGAVFGADPTGSELAERTVVGLPDVALAVAAGAAGVLGFTTRLSEALVGVMVAAALLPALVATGLLLGAGHVVAATSSAALLLVNLIGINLAAVVMFYAQGIRPRVWWKEEQAAKATAAAIAVWLVLLVALSGVVMRLGL